MVSVTHQGNFPSITAQGNSLLIQLTPKQVRGKRFPLYFGSCDNCEIVGFPIQSIILQSRDSDRNKTLWGFSHLPSLLKNYFGFRCTLSVKPCYHQCNMIQELREQYTILNKSFFRYPQVRHALAEQFRENALEWCKIPMLQKVINATTL